MFATGVNKIGINKYDFLFPMSIKYVAIVTCMHNNNNNFIIRKIGMNNYASRMLPVPARPKTCCLTQNTRILVVHKGRERM